jgi:hypothetical protein
MPDINTPNLLPCPHCGTTADDPEIVAFVHATRYACLAFGGPPLIGSLRPCCWAQGLINQRKQD